MTWEGWLTIGVLLAMMVGLVRHVQATDVTFLGGLTLLTLTGVITPSEALAGFKNEGVLTVAALFVVAAALVETGFLSAVTRRTLGDVTEARRALQRAIPATVVSSAFLNNTTVVAMAMPALLEWCRKRRVAASRLLLPLSYASILGGVCTLIGTSTNLVVHGMMKQSPLGDLASGFGMWELSAVGVPIAVAGTLYLTLLAPRLLPERKEFLEQLAEARREFLAEIIVRPPCPLIGQSVQAAGLRGLPGLFLIEIERADGRVSPVGPNEELRAGDRLTFTGIVSTLAELQRIPGLQPAGDVAFELDPSRPHGGRLCEAVVSTSSPLVGQGIREANFRTTYNAVVVAIHRNGRRITVKIGDVRLEPGDTLLLQTGPGFVNAHRNNPDFFLVSEVADASPMRHGRAWVAATIAGSLVLLLTMPEILRWSPAPPEVPDWFEVHRVIFAMLAAGSMVVTRALPAAVARRSIDWQVLVIIAAALGVGTAMDRSGAAAAIAAFTIDLVPTGWGTVGALGAIWVLTWLLTELMSNNAAAALMFPVAIATAQQVGADPRAFAVAVAVAASAGFVLPVGYQTHLMVFGPGGYRVGDFVKLGAPMILIWFVAAMLVIPRLWL
jgi:di/tricarboxylate transporter